MLKILNMGTTDTFLLTPDLVAVGKSIIGLDLRKKAGATIIAVVRDEKPFTNPPPSMELCAGDLIVLVGSHAQMDMAFSLLEEKMPDAETSDSAIPATPNSAIDAPIQSYYTGN
jgi:uncharacterized protein with PhoU and TrkA domain